MPYNVLDRSLAAAAPVTTIGQPSLVGEGMTLADIKEELAASMLGRTDIEDPRLDRWINWAHRDLISSLDLPDMYGSLDITTVADQDLYLLPSTVYSILGAAIVDTGNYPIDGGKPLRKIELMKYRMLPVADDDEPTSYFKYGKDLLVLYPKPTTAALEIAVDFKARAGEMTDPGHYPVVGTEWHEAIVLNAVAKGLRALQEWQGASVAKTEYLDYVRRRIDPKAAEDEGRTVLSSVPRNRTQLRRDGSLRRDNGLY